MDEDDVVNLWGPPFVMQEDTLHRKQILLGGFQLWFDCRTDVLEENFQNEKYCEQVWWILTEKKQDSKINELERDSLPLGNDMALGSSYSDKKLIAVLPDVDTSSAKSDLDEEENTSSISDALTIETRDSSNDTKDIIDPETSLKPQETAANEPLTVEVADDAYTTSSSSKLASKIEEAEEHSCSDQVIDPIKQVPENKSSSAISRENVEGSTFRPLLLETKEKVNATNEDGEVLKNLKQSDSMQDIITASEPFTTESLLEMCDELDKGRETPCDVKSKRSHTEALKIVVKDEIIINLVTEASQKTESNTLSKPRTVLMKKRQSQSCSSDNKGTNSSFIRTTKQKVGGEVDPVKKSTPEVIKVSSVPKLDEDSLMVISTKELMKMTGRELKSIAKALKVTRYYKLKKEDLLQQITTQLNPS